MGARERNKGARGERELAAWLTERAIPLVAVGSNQAHLIARTLSALTFPSIASASALSAFGCTPRWPRRSPMPVTRCLLSPIAATVASGWPCCGSKI